MRNKIVNIIGGVFLVIAILAVVGLGIWTYQLNTRFATAQKQLASLQADYDKLKADNTKLTADLGQANSTIDQAKADLAKVHSDLKTANGDKADQVIKLSTLKNLMPVLESIYLDSGSISGIEDKVLRTADNKLIGFWYALTKTPNAKTAHDFYLHLFGRIDEAVK